MARRRYNNKGGTLNSSLTAGGVTIDFGTDPGFATIVGSDYIPLVLDPPAGGVPNVKFEVVYLTAFTAGQTTGTISRGKEGTSGQSHSGGATWACAATILDAMQPIGNLQNGVIGSGDGAVSAISINTGTGALTFTLASAEPMWVQDANGLLVPVYFLSAAQTITPSLPASTKYAVIGVEIDTLGNVTLVKGADTATQLNTAALIASNTPATSSGNVRVADFAVWNNAGTFNFSDHTTVASQGVNWIDRRPWARGGYASIVRTQNAAAGNDYTAPTSIAAIDATNLTIRLECTGNPIRTRLKFRSPGNASILFKFFPWMDGTYISPMDSSDSSFVFTQTGEGGWEYNWEFAPSAGSHSFTWATLRASGTSALVLYARADIPLEFLVEELLRPAANNGTA